jgi:hypothetical protein
VRFVHSGFLGDDWESEYEALSEGDAMYLNQLAQYVRSFRGRAVATIEHFQPDLPDREAAMAILRGAMGLGDGVAVGDAVRLEPTGLGPLDGTVDYVSKTIIGVRTDDALYRFAFIPMGGGIYLGHHIYRDDVDVPAVTSAWAAWLGRAVARAYVGSRGLGSDTISGERRPADQASVVVKVPPGPRILVLGLGPIRPVAATCSSHEPVDPLVSPQPGLYGC